ncbi:MAG TPA: HAMP domain-containing sensor histidine kinase [Candidatus Sulfotelmatobacter sp.]|nr:HAMP domain-containing sensor histidine kinase [Candidatus Sulfotelmatobacter sp.]
MQQRMRVAQRMQRRGRHRPWYRWQGFGCLFGLLFLLVAGSLVTVVATLVATFGPVPALIVAATVVAILVTIGRTLGSAAFTLDRLVAATQRVSAGDYSVRVGRPVRRSMRSVTELTRGFDTMVARLERDEEQRRTLLADVTHELRTPLTVITGNLEALLDGVYPADADHLGAILDETRVLDRLIEDLRTLALSEAGTLALHPEPTDLDVLLSDVVAAFTPAAAGAGVRLTTAVEGDLPVLELDPVRTREVLSNLVANALRHTPRGGTVTLGARASRDGVRLTVADTGAGIPPDLLDHVFDRFVKGTDSHGSGLGLAIARGLVEAQGGTISAASPPGGGARFEIVLPRHEAG